MGEDYICYGSDYAYDNGSSSSFYAYDNDAWYQVDEKIHRIGMLAEEVMSELRLENPDLSWEIKIKSDKVEIHLSFNHHLFSIFIIGDSIINSNADDEYLKKYILNEILVLSINMGVSE